MFIRIGRIVLYVLGGLAIATVLAFAFGWLVMILWNAILPELFQVPQINFWQAWGLIILSKILFGGMGQAPGKHHHRFRDRCDDGDWKGNKSKHWFRRHFHSKKEGDTPLQPDATS